MTETEIIEHLKDLRTDKNSSIWDERTRGSAPHKPFLLLSIIDGIQTGWIKGPELTLSEDLIETFFNYWKSIMQENRNTTIALPFFHMKSEPFWELQYKEGMDHYKTSPSLGGILDRVDFAKINDTLFHMMQDDDRRKLIITTILNTYFGNKTRSEVLEIHQINIGAYRYAQKLELLAAEPFQKYHVRSEDQSYYSWQKIQQRQQGFGLKVRTNYAHRCAICRAKVKTSNGESLVEGAHIIPWSESKNDDPRNGLALCKNHHWMFDVYLLTVQPDYRIKLSSWLKEEGGKIESTLAWDQKEILLPNNRRFLPDEKALKDHNEQFKSVG